MEIAKPLPTTLLAAAVAMPVAGRVADIVGKQRVLVTSAAILLIGSVVCALSSSLAPMLVGRALQGTAMGFIPVGISLMREITPPHMSSTAIAAMSATLGVGGAIGLPLAAWIADAFSWHDLFWLSGALALLIVVATATLVPHVGDAHPARIDVVGAVGLAVGLVPLLVGVSKGNEWGWTDARTLVTVLGGLVVLGLWAAYEVRASDALVDLRTTVQLPVLLTNVAAVAIGFGMMAQAIVVPQLLQLRAVAAPRRVLHHVGGGRHRVRRDAHPDPRRRPDRGAFELCFVVGALAAFVGAVITAFIPRRAALATPAQEPVAAPAQRG